MIFSNRDRINFIVIVFLIGRQMIFSAIAPVVSFFHKMVSCYFNILKLLVILICTLIILIFTLYVFFILFIR